MRTTNVNSFLTLIKHFIYILLFPFSSCKIPNSSDNLRIPSIPQILSGVSNCDVRILTDGLQEFQFYPINDYIWPTNVIFVPKYYPKHRYKTFSGYWIEPEDASFAINVVKTRIPFCVINLLFIGNQAVLQGPTHNAEFNFIALGQKQVSISLYFTLATRRYLQFNGQRWIESLSKTYTILVVTDESILSAGKFKVLAAHSFVENFAIISSP